MCKYFQYYANSYMFPCNEKTYLIYSSINKLKCICMHPFNICQKGFLKILVKSLRIMQQYC